MFPALTIMCNSSSRGFKSLIPAVGARNPCGTHTPIHIKSLNLEGKFLVRSGQMVKQSMPHKEL